MHIEIAHFYMNEKFSSNMLDHLKSHIFSDDDVLYLFIDDMHVEEYTLDVSRLCDLAQSITGHKVYVVNESEMREYVKRSIGYIENLQVITDISGEQQKLMHDGRELYDFTTNRASCQMLSFVWTLYRIGVFYSELRDCLTIIDKKYTKLERRVCAMLPPDLKKRAFYRFF